MPDSYTHTDSGQVHTWIIPELPAHEIGYFNLKVAVGDTVTYGTLLHNEVALEFTDENDGDFYPTLYDELDVTIGIPEAKIQIQKVAGTSVVEAGQPVTYILTITNTGQSDLHGIVVSDTFPAKITYSDSYPAVPAATDTGSAVLTWDFSASAGLPDTLAHAESVRIQVTGVSNISAVGSLTNQATVRSLNVNDSSVTASDTTSVVIIIPAANLQIEKVTATSVVNAGDSITYILTIANYGNQAISNITVTDTIPTGLNYIRSEPTQSDTGSNTVAWTGISLAKGEERQIQITVASTIDDSGSYTNTATVRGQDQNNNYLSDTDTSPVTITTPTPNLQIEKVTATSVVNAGDSITYILTIANYGNQAISNITVTDTIPTGLDYMSSQPTESSAGGNTVTWTITSLAPGEQKQIQLTVATTIDDQGETINTATVRGQDENNNWLTDRDTSPVFITVLGPGIDVEKVASHGKIGIGGEESFIIRFTNIGQSNLTRVVITDTLPADLRYTFSDPMADTHPAVGDTGTVIWTFNDTFIPGQSKDILLTVKASTSAASGDTLTNIAYALGTDENNQDVTDTDAAKIIVRPAGEEGPCIQVEKVVGSSSFEIGGSGTYLITVNNCGTQVMTNVILSDTLDTRLTFVSSDHSCTPTGQILTWDLGTLNVGELRQIQLNVNVADTATAGGLENLARVTADGGYSDQDTASITVVEPQAAIDVEKVSSHGYIEAGGRESFLVTVNNRGNDTLTGITVTDTWTATGFSFVSAEPTASSQSGNTVTWQGLTLRPGELWQARITIRAGADLAAGDVCSDTVTATGTDSDNDEYTDSDTATVTVV
ncbi:DUF11 domain-containing protein, partial [bacterium]|nr:DUF11 domain-containing protein [bacterium]